MPILPMAPSVERYLRSVWFLWLGASGKTARARRIVQSACVAKAGPEKRQIERRRVRGDGPSPSQLSKLIRAAPRSRAFGTILSFVPWTPWRARELQFPD